MIHPVEQKTWTLVEYLLKEIDPGCEGWAIDAGVGADDWWFVPLAELGFKTVAIDPMFTEAAVAATYEHQCHARRNTMLGARLDKRMLYTVEDPNLHTGMFGRCKHTTGVEEKDGITLQYLRDFYDFTRLTVLKLDIEGMEPEVIANLPICTVTPDILIFEFGGFVQRQEETGPWSKINQSAFHFSLQTLQAGGYAPFWAITDVDPHPFFINAASWSDLIKPETGYGNIVCIRAEKLHG